MRTISVISFVVFSLSAGLVPLAVVAAPAVADRSEDVNLKLFFKDYLEKRFQQQPLEATKLGDHRFDARMDDISPEARALWRELAGATLKKLPKEVDYKRLSRDGQIDFGIFRNDLETRLWNMDNRHPFEEDPRTYGDYINDSVYLLLTQSTLPRETNVANCIARMAEIPRIIATAKKTLKHPPKPILETAIRQNRGAIGLYETELFELVGPTEQLGRLKAAAAPVVAALKDYQAFLEGELMSRATGDWRLGKRKFNQKFDLETLAGVSANQTLADAEAEYARVRRDMYVVARQLWSRYFPKRALPPDDDRGRMETIRLVIDAVSQEHGKPEELLHDAQATVDKIKAFIRERDILRLPEPDRCHVIEMPEFRRGNSLAYLDNAPPLDPEADSFYAVSPPPSDWGADRVRSFLEEYNRNMLPILTIHEAYPGHYVQLEYSNRSDSLIRKVLQSGVMIEGWAVYGEQTMLDQGFGDGDLRIRLMQLKFYLRAVVNAILDHKMHCDGMTDDEAMKLLVDGSFQSEGEAKLKIIRAKQSSVQLSTYFVGRMAHYRLRQETERRLADRFELGRYHEAVIDQGSVPMKYMPELVRARLELPR
ncbi:MAG TPA: DUF885 domain-containing protein [Candidatus Paceibacterota bacterium]|nr:DUF885 domain-containing protein [Candidatus Paceibacterota bacterium]